MKYSVSEQEILKLFPYPAFRKGQKEIIVRMNQKFNSGTRCILLSAPTGLGKSGINATFCRAIANSFYTTPQNNLIDQIRNDPFLSKYFCEIKGRQNYKCMKDYTGDTTVEVGMCTRFPHYIPTYCNHTAECPYYSQKYRAIQSNNILTNPTYLMLEGKVQDPTPPRLGIRNLLIIDEGHFISEKIIEVSSLTVKPWILPVRIPDIRSRAGLKTYLESVLVAALKEQTGLKSQLDLAGQLTITAVRKANYLNELKTGIETFIDNTEQEWVWEVDFSTIEGKVYPSLKVTPLTATLFGSMLWSKSSSIVIISSATLFNPRAFISDAGLYTYFRPDEILYLECPSVFPKENRPVVDMTSGKLTFKHMNENLENACLKLEQILSMEPGNVAIHIPSYELVDKIIAMMRHINTKHWDRFITHSSADRNEKLISWMNGSTKDKVFFAVAFSEGYDWKGEICDAQVLFKVPFPDIRDKRVARMIQLGKWNWYYTRTLTTIIQSYGRAVRSETDKKRFYIIDSSFWSLVRRMNTLKVLPEWFREVLPVSVVG